MVAHRTHVILAIACLTGWGAGCRTFPPGPEQARAESGPSADGSEAQSGYDGWLFNRLTGKDKPPEASLAAARSSPTTSGVRQVSATETLPPGPKETVVTAATLAAASKPQAKKKDVDEDEGRGFDFGAFAPSNVVKAVKTWAGYGPDENVARAAFDQGDRLFREKKYAEAAKQFATAADRWPDSTLEEDALFWRAESLFFADYYSAAHNAYEKLLKKYEYSRHLDKAVAREFAIGRYWERFNAAEPHWPMTPNLFDNGRPLFDTWGHSLKAYEHVRLNDPTGPLADDALMAGANAYFVHGRYEDAAINYDLLRKEYPKSDHQKNAHLLGLESKQRMYQGPLYDGMPLKEASEIADQTLIRFGPTLGSDRDQVIAAKNRIVEQQAQRSVAVAEYYERNHYYGSARYYYNHVLEEFPQTRAAVQAKERLQQIKDLPAEPPDQLKWLTEAFGPVKRR